MNSRFSTIYNFFKKKPHFNDYAYSATIQFLVPKPQKYISPAMPQQFETAAQIAIPGIYSFEELAQLIANKLVLSCVPVDDTVYTSEHFDNLKDYCIFKIWYFYWVISTTPTFPQLHVKPNFFEHIPANKSITEKNVSVQVLINNVKRPQFIEDFLNYVSKNTEGTQRIIETLGGIRFVFSRRDLSIKLEVKDHKSIFFSEEETTKILATAKEIDMTLSNAEKMIQEQLNCIKPLKYS